jgi:hypothetical protein
VKLNGIAIATNHRSAGGEIADQTMDEMLRCARALGRFVGSENIFVLAWVDVRNQPSKRLLERSGFSFRRVLPNNLEDWIIEIA